MKYPNYVGRASDARMLAERLQQYWIDRGRPDVKVWVERDAKSFKKPIYNVRTDVKLTCIPPKK